MAVYRQVKRVSDLDLLSKVIGDAQVLLAVNKKNWKTSLSNIDQQKIVKIEYSGTEEDGKINSIKLTMKDGTIHRLGVYNGTIGDKGKTGKTGERGDKGDSAVLDYNRSENYLMIVNDCETDDATKVLSASQGVMMNKSIHELRETYMSDEKYQLLFNDLVFMDAEFISTQDDEPVLLFNADPADHKLYIKYWTYESDGSVDYFVYNDFAKTYDSLNADLWDDIYLGATSGYFTATNAQLTDGNDLYVINRSNDTYEKITVDENGNRSFVYYIKDADCYVNVIYDKQTKLYDYNLVATELNISVYQQTGSDEYTRITNKESLDLSGFTLYFEKIDDEYVPITDINAYLEKKEYRYYKLIENKWVEVNSLNEIKLSDFEEYMEVVYNKMTNTNTFTHYKPVTTIFETYYESYVGVLTNYSISFYIYDDNREYYTRRLTEKTPGVWDYEYTKINIPFWVDCEYITDEEDQTILLLFSDKEQSEIETIDPIYVNSIEFEESEIEIANGFVKDISVNISPINANVTDMVLDYDDSLITIYEDGRIAAAHTTDITTETILTLSSVNNPNIKDSVKVRCVTPISEIVLNVESIELYPGDTKQLEYTTVPAEVTNNKVIWSVSDEKMIKVSENGLVELVKDENGEYTTGTCTLVCTAEDGYGAKLEIPVLVAIPVEKIMFGKYEYDEKLEMDVFKPNDSETNICFIGFKNTLNTVVEPRNATEQTIKYSSSDESIITIDETTGEYTPLMKGEAELYATTTDGTNITISKHMVINVGVNEINVTGIDSKLDIGLTNEYEVTLTPELPDNNEIEIIVSDKSLVSYTEPVLVEGTTNKYRGTITAMAPGIVNITFMAKDGTKTGKGVDMTITIPISDLTFENQHISLFIGDMVALQAIIGPHDATNASAELTWKSSNDSIATVDGYGRVQAKGAGKVIISAIVKESTAVMASCTITVNVKCTDLIINDGLESCDIIIGNKSFISSLVTPDNANNQFIEWMSSDESIVNVTDSGVIFGNNIGSAIITAITTDGSNISKSFNVNVINNVIEAPTQEPTEIPSEIPSELPENPEGGEEITE